MRRPSRGPAGAMPTIVSRHWRTWPVLLLTAAGCASAAPSTPAGCRSDLARSAQPLAAAADSTALQQAVSRLLQSGGLVLASVTWDSTGARSGVSITAESLADPTRAALREAIDSTTPDRAGPGQRLFLVLRDDVGPGPRRVDRFAGCAPAFVRRSWLAQEMQDVARNLGIRQRLTAVLMVEVRTNGRAGDVLVDAASGDPRFDQAAVLVFRRAKFTPGMVEGIPIVVWAQFPVTATPVGRAAEQGG